MKRLILYQDTFLWVNASQGLLYNTHNGKSYEFLLNPVTCKICNKLLDYNNLYAVDIDIEDASVFRFAVAIECNALGFISDVEREWVSLPPLLCLPQDKRVKSGKLIYEDLISSLYSVCFYMGGRGWESDYYLQTIYPSSFEGYLKVDDIKFFIENNRLYNAIAINIVFSDIKNYPEMDELMQFLQERKGIDTITIYVRWDEIECPTFSAKIQGRGFNIVVLCNGITGNTMNNVCQLLDRNKIISYITDLNSEMVEGVDYVPLFTGANFDFFQKNVFLSRTEIKQSGLSKRIIFAHQVLNTHYFGKLIVLPNRNVYSNPSKTALGTIETPMIQLIATEFSKNHAWRVIRNSEKCRKCLYHDLCPSPTFYENIMHVDCIISDERC